MDMIEMVEYLADQFKVERPLEVLTFTMSDLFKQYCHFEFTPTTTTEELRKLAHHLKVDVESAKSIDDYFYLIFMDKIENQWPKDRLVFVEKYPPYQAALARIGNDGWAERFEVYWRGLELGNAFHELNNPVLQRERAHEDLAKKRELGKKEIQLDEEFFAALDYGLPPAAGIAVGLERLYMALFKISEIHKIAK
jgi:lysyl-tRNA synthetase class 2